MITATIFRKCDVFGIFLNYANVYFSLPHQSKIFYINHVFTLIKKPVFLARPFLAVRGKLIAMEALSAGSGNSTFDGLDVLNKIKQCINRDASCTGFDLPNFGQSYEELRDSVSIRLANQTDFLGDQRVLSDMPFPVNFDKIYIAGICFAYALIIITSILGNFLVCYVIIKMRRMHTVTNLFILNLAVSDLLITCLNIPFSLVRLLMDDWPLGSVLCQLLPFVQVTAVYVSSWTMVSS